MMKTTVTETPPIWLWGSSREPIRAAHSGETRADVLIVGAGIAGLATAYHLAAESPGLRVVVAEAAHVGHGATARSTGIVGPGLSAPLHGLRRRYGDAVTGEAFASTLRGVAGTRRLLEEAAIDCDARLEDHVIGALTPGQARRIDRHVGDLEDLGFTVRRWDSHQARDRLGDGYRCAFSYDDVLLLDPYQLVTGLARAAERLGVLVVERTRVTRLESRSDHVRAHVAGGVIVADHVLLTIDGYAAQLNPHPSSVVPVRTHAVATAPLSPADRAGLAWDGVGGVIDQRNYFDYYRLGAGGRLIFGGGPVRYPSGDPHRDAVGSSAVFAEVERRLRVRFPTLRAVPVEARWSGLTGGTLDRLPVVGPLRGDPRVHFAGGWCGHGLAMCVDTAERYAGVLGRSLSGTRHGPGRADRAGTSLPWLRSHTAGVPTAGLRAVALPAYLRLMDWQDRLTASAGPTSSGSAGDQGGTRRDPVRRTG
jgi:glycine/D-amino acid oxidase-like deaminating enzyme